MATPFATAVKPDVDSGIVVVPTSLTSISSAAIMLSGADFTNPGSDPEQIKITDTAGNLIAAPFWVQPGAPPVTIGWNMKPVTGVKWQSIGGAGVTQGQLYGYLAT